MTTKKNSAKAAQPAATIDPSIPFKEITLLGKTCKLCFRFRELAKADANLRRQGVRQRHAADAAESEL